MNNPEIIEYRPQENKTYYYIDGIEVASLDFNSDNFEINEEMDITEEQGEVYYAEMIQDREEYLNQ